MKTKLLIVVVLSALTALASIGAQEPAPKRPRQIAVNVLGEINHPGRYFLPEGATLLDALAAAGGPGQDADLKIVTIIHAAAGDKPQSDRVNVKAVLAGTKAAPAVHDCDTVSFKRRSTAKIF